jgi:hypothetical protein
MQPIEPMNGIGPRTDEVLDELDLDDSDILSLHEMILTQHPSQWVNTLMSHGWHPKQSVAKSLVNAILEDLGQEQQRKVAFHQSTTKSHQQLKLTK